MEDNVEKRFAKSDGDVKALLAKANRPMSEKVAEAKAALKASNE